MNYATKLEKTHHELTQYILRSKIDWHTFYKLLENEWETWEKNLFRNYLEKNRKTENEIILDEAYAIICASKDFDQFDIEEDDDNVVGEDEYVLANMQECDEEMRNLKSKNKSQNKEIGEKNDIQTKECREYLENMFKLRFQKILNAIDLNQDDNLDRCEYVIYNVFQNETLPPERDDYYRDWGVPKDFNDDTSYLKHQNQWKKISGLKYKEIGIKNLPQVLLNIKLNLKECGILNFFDEGADIRIILEDVFKLIPMVEVNQLYDALIYYHCIVLVLEKGKRLALAKIRKTFALRFNEKIKSYVQQIEKQEDSITDHVIHLKNLLGIATYR